MYKNIEFIKKEILKSVLFKNKKIKRDFKRFLYLLNFFSK
jgi:hypothetical protein